MYKLSFLLFVVAIWWHTKSMPIATTRHLPLMMLRNIRNRWRPIAMSVTLRRVSSKENMHQWVSIEPDEFLFNSSRFCIFQCRVIFVCKCQNCEADSKRVTRAMGDAGCLTGSRCVNRFCFWANVHNTLHVLFTRRNQNLLRFTVYYGMIGVCVC